MISLPHSFRYILIWINIKQKLNSILKVQEKAIRIMLRLKWTESVKNYFPNFGILTVKGNFIIHTIMLAKNRDKEIGFNSDNHG